MKIRVCRTLVEPEWIIVPSNTRDDKTYVTIPSTIWNDPICDCRGYHFRGSCSHIDNLEGKRCIFWTNDLDDQSPCPLCGADTVLFEMEPEL